MSFVGFDNFAKVLGDASFFASIRITAFQAIPGTILVNLLAIVLAVLINRPGRISKLYRTAYFFPLLISSVAVGFIWKSLLTYGGIVNGLLLRLGAERVDFIRRPMSRAMVPALRMRMAGHGLAPALTSTVVLCFTGFMRLFDMPAVLTGGGPGGATETMAVLVIIAAFSTLLTRSLQRREERII